VLPRALSLRTISWQLGSILGPTLGGLALVWVGPEGVYAIDAISYGAILAGVLLIRYVPTQAPTVRPNLAAAIEGVRFLWKSPILWSTMLLDFLATFFVESTLLFPIFADKVLHVGEEDLGKLFAAPAVGAVIAAFAMLWLEPPKRQGLTILISVGIYGVAATLFGLSTTLPWAFAWLAVSGAADAVSMVVRNTLRQELTPDALRGRMTSVGLIFFAGGPMLGEFEAGAVAQVFSLKAAFVSGGAASVALAVAFALAAPWLRAYRRGEPVPITETVPPSSGPAT
jgi:MFS family permease